MTYDGALEKAASIEYRHQWLNWRAMGIIVAVGAVAMVVLVWDIAVNNHPNSWGGLIGLAIGFSFIGGLALLDWVENRHMSYLFGRIRLAASRVQAKQAKKEGKLH